MPGGVFRPATLALRPSLSSPTLSRDCIAICPLGVGNQETTRAICAVLTDVCRPPIARQVPGREGADEMRVV